MVVFLVIVFTAILIAAIRFREKRNNAMCTSTTRLDGKNCLVTGGTAGMGFEVAREFAARGARVIIACPFPDEGSTAEQTIIEETGNKKVTFKYLNLGSLESVRQFAQDILDNEEKLHVLVNNAGVGTPKDVLTSDGLSFIMEVNYFGHFLLTILLLPLLKKSATPLDPSRIINLTSVSHWLVSDLTGMERPKRFAPRSYCNSKICMIFFAKELAKKLDKSKVVVNAVDPGLVGTRIYESCPIIGLGYIAKVLISCIFKNTREGAQTTLHVALDSGAARVSGQCFGNCKVCSVKAFASDDVTAKEVWDKSVKLVRLTEEELMSVKVAI